ncbi:MAG: tetratricopeptide repeat protein [Chloroflexota bacterium]|nr:tetratricopeptide repeat protein [Chloroflexota bacterium]MDE2909483.1 tetratricopeptide repeat protein [Chloroflexota bacterium]
MSSLPSAEKIGRAWRMHRDGDNQGALRLFEEVLAASPDSVDAHYGMGLAYKARGDMSAAAASFGQALSVTEQALSAVRVTSHAEGQHGANDLETNFDDRYMMLTRMLKQRINDVGGVLS